MNGIILLLAAFQPAETGLLATGDLSAFFQETARPMVLQNVRVESRQMALGTNDHTAAFHTLGTRIMPDRQFMGASEATEIAIAEKLADHTLQEVF
jgi:phage gpG-like protein